MSQYDKEVLSSNRGYRSVGIDPSSCTGCKICELVCSLEKEATFNYLLSRIRIYSQETPRILDTPVTCRLCDGAPCVAACPVEALSQDLASGMIGLKRDLCIGCVACVEACPYGAIYIHPREQVPVTCDLCDGRVRCVAVCPSGALRY